MEITEVRIKLMEDGGDRLKAFCSITFDNCFVVRDLKIIEGTTGPFVAMPSRKLTAHCPQCGCKNHLRSAYCNQCGGRLKEGRVAKDDEGRTKLYADIAHPINSACREMIQARVVEAYEAELELAQQPGYVSRYDEYDYDTPEPHFESVPERFAAPRSAGPPAKTRTRSDAPPETGPRPHTGGEVKRGRAKPQAPDSFGEGIF